MNIVVGIWKRFYTFGWIRRSSSYYVCWIHSNRCQTLRSIRTRYSWERGEKNRLFWGKFMKIDFGRIIWFGVWVVWISQFLVKSGLKHWISTETRNFHRNSRLPPKFAFSSETRDSHRNPRFPLKFVISSEVRDFQRNSFKIPPKTSQISHLLNTKRFTEENKR